MRTEKFKMERNGLVEEGQKVSLTEYKSSRYFYVIEPAVAMSGCYGETERIFSREGTVKSIEKTAKGFYVLVDLEK